MNAADHLKALIACRSVTPVDAGAQAYLERVLAAGGFAVERMRFSTPGAAAADNLFATIGTGTPHLAFAGHTDVVPAGDDARWTHPPFAGEVADGMMFGRGAVDMKGGIACFLAAAFDLVAGGQPAGTLSFLITGDEEGAAVNGTVRLIAWALDQGHRFDAVLVGEPTSRERVGDTVKIGRRGTLSATVRTTGRQGHVAYPRAADNPIPRLIRVLARLAELRLDEGSADFEPSNLEITSVDVGNPAANVIPAEASARFNVRFNDRWSPAGLADRLAREVAAAAGDGQCELTIEPGAGDWFLTPGGPLVDLLSEAIVATVGIEPERSTGGGTSDARFFKDVCPVVDFGLVGQTMHQIDERVALADLDRLTAIYRDFLGRFFSGARR